MSIDVDDPKVLAYRVGVLEEKFDTFSKTAIEKLDALGHQLQSFETKMQTRESFAKGALWVAGTAGSLVGGAVSLAVGHFLKQGH